MDFMSYRYPERSCSGTWAPFMGFVPLFIAISNAIAQYIPLWDMDDPLGAG
jgi:hypothetical protein